MQSFLKNILIFYAFLSLLITLGARTIATYHHSGQIYTAIETADNCPSCTTLILGDSTGEIYDRTPSNDSICIARTNRAITLTGQYLLLKKFIANSQNQNKLKVFLILHPKGLQASLNDQYSFNYFYQPFFWDIVKGEIPLEISKQIPDFNWIRRCLLALPILRVIDFNPIHAHRMKKPKNLSTQNYLEGLKAELPSFTKTTISAMHLLCEEHNIHLQILPPILKEDWRHVPLADFKKPFENCGLLNEISRYDKSIQYLPNSQFRDGIHLKETILDSLGVDPLGLILQK